MPRCIIIAGPNGAGKTTIAKRLLPGMDCLTFINADEIARGLSPLTPNQRHEAIAAGKIMLRRMDEAVANGEDFAFESTLSSRTVVHFLQQCKAAGYEIIIVYVFLQSADLAQQRIAQRVAEGAHSIPDEDVIRRYGRSLANLRALYLPLADKWSIFDNSATETKLIAWGEDGEVSILHPLANDILEGDDHE